MTTIKVFACYEKIYTPHPQWGGGGGCPGPGFAPCTFVFIFACPYTLNQRIKQLSWRE